jgi:hypothetical protein
MVIKLDRTRFYRIFDSDSYDVQCWPRESIPSGKLSVSIKIGKKRKLVAGKMDAIPESCPGLPLMWRYVFKPNNPKKMNALLEVTQFDNWNIFLPD